MFAGTVARTHCDKQFVYFFLTHCAIISRNKLPPVFGHRENAAILFWLCSFFLDDYAPCAFAFVHFVTSHFHHSTIKLLTLVIDGFIMRIADRLYLQEIRVL